MADIPRMVVMSLNRRRAWVVSGSGEKLVDRRLLEEDRGSKPFAPLPARNNDELTSTMKQTRLHTAFTCMGKPARSVVETGNVK